MRKSIFYLCLVSSISSYELPHLIKMTKTDDHLEYVLEQHQETPLLQCSIICFRNVQCSGIQYTGTLCTIATSEDTGTKLKMTLYKVQEMVYKEFEEMQLNTQMIFIPRSLTSEGFILVSAYIVEIDSNKIILADGSLVPDKGRHELGVKIYGNGTCFTMEYKNAYYENAYSCSEMVPPAFFVYRMSFPDNATLISTLNGEDQVYQMRRAYDFNGLNISSKLKPINVHIVF